MGCRTSDLRHQFHAPAGFTLDCERIHMSNTSTSTSSSAPFLATGDFIYSATVRPVLRPCGSVNVRLTSRWTTAKDPQAEQVALDLTLSQAELAALITVLQAGLQPQA